MLYYQPLWTCLTRIDERMSREAPWPTDAPRLLDEYVGQSTCRSGGCCAAHRNGSPVFFDHRVWSAWNRKTTWARDCQPYPFPFRDYFGCAGSVADLRRVIERHANAVAAWAPHHSLHRRSSPLE